MFLWSSHMFAKVRKGMEFTSFLKLSYFQSFNWVNCVLGKDNVVPFHPWQREMEKKWKRERERASVWLHLSWVKMESVSQPAHTHITSTELKKTSQSDSLWHIRGVRYRVVEVCECLCMCEYVWSSNSPRKTSDYGPCHPTTQRNKSFSIKQNTKHVCSKP